MGNPVEDNVKLLQAVERHPTLYDRSDENYRKRLPSENSWDLVASEVGESVEKCKRRWRQLRNDYTRWCNADANRRRQGQRRYGYPLGDAVRFLDRHLHLADVNIDEERSGSERDRDSNRDSESRDNHSVSVKGDAAFEEKSVNEASLITQFLEEEEPSTREADKDKPKEKPRQKRGAPEKSVERELPESEEPERSPDQDSYLQSDQEGDEPIEEEHLDQLEDFDFEDEEESLQEKDKEAPETSNDSPASNQSQFFIKQNKEHLLIIGKKNSTFASGDQTEAEDFNMDDPLDEGSSMESGKSLRRRENTQLSNRRLRRIKEVPIKKPTPALRNTRFQRRKSMSLAVGERMNSATSPVRLTQVPRSLMGSKSVHVKKAAPLHDGIFSRPAAPSTEPRQGQKQGVAQTQPQRQHAIYPRRETVCGKQPETTPVAPKRSVGRPPKKLEEMQRVVGPPIRQQSPSTPNVLTINKPVNTAVKTGSNIVNKGINPTTTTTKTPGNPTKVVAKTTLKPPENITVMSYSPGTNSTPSPTGSNNAKPSSISSGLPPCTLVTTVATSTAAAAPVISVASNPDPSKRDWTTQTESDVVSDQYFLEMIRPKMKEMNPRQKMHFKKKVFQALMETFDDANDFPEAGELQHFNINTPSGFEQVSDPELRLIRELVSMVSAAKVSPRGLPQAKTVAQSQPKEGVCYTQMTSSDILRGTRGLNIPRHLIQRVYKPVSGSDSIGNNGTSSGAEKKMFRFLPMTNGKPNGNASASLEDLRKDSVDSEHSGVRSLIVPPASPKAATMVASVRPQGSSISSLFGPSSSVSTAKSGPSLKARALARRYSICTNGNQANNNVQPVNPAPANANSLNSNLSPMEAAALKRRLMGPAQPMVPPTQRPRYSSGQPPIVTPQGNSLLVKKPVGVAPGNQKQPVSPTGGVALAPQKTPQISNVQGNAFKDFAQPKVAASSSTSSTSSTSPPSGERNPQSVALKRSLVVANAKGSLLAEKPASKAQPQNHSPRYSNMTAATIAADDYSLAGLKREPVDNMDDQDDILGM